jgi:hypothetical protein
MSNSDLCHVIRGSRLDTGVFRPAVRLKAGRQTNSKLTTFHLIFSLHHQLLNSRFLAVLLGMLSNLGNIGGVQTIKIYLLQSIVSPQFSS